MTNTNAPTITSYLALPTKPVSPLQALTEEIEKATLSIRKRLGHANDFSQELFFMGDGIQRAALDRFFDLLRPGTWSPAGLAQMSSNLWNESSQAARFFIPGQTSNLSWMEFRNKLEVFLTVQNLPATLGLSADKLDSLPQLVERAYSLPPFVALWGVEGLGHYYADTYWDLHGPPEGLLSDPATVVPEKSLLMLHAGMGMALAYRLVIGLLPQSSPTKVRETVQFFVTLCRANSREGYMGAAIESLGLIVRDFHPDMVRGVSQALAETNAELTGFFWHGVGRALYFSRAYFLPILRTPWRAIEKEGVAGSERMNLLAGLAWAVTLVNMQHPQIVESTVNTYVRQSEMREAFADGMSSSLAMREDTTPGAIFAKSFCAYRSGCASFESSRIWQTLVADSCKEAWDRYPRLKRDRLLDQLFRYQPANNGR